jgi:polysaccharide biosynthesis/export protein
LPRRLRAAGGLIDIQADPGSVFIYRREPRELAEKLGVDCSKMDGPTVPIVYSVSFSDPAGYFLATRVQMHNKDVIFAANAQAVEITKFATFLNTLISVPSNIGALGITWQSLRIISGSGPASSGAAVVTTPVVVSSPPH